MMFIFVNCLFPAKSMKMPYLNLIFSISCKSGMFEDFIIACNVDCFMLCVSLWRSGKPMSIVAHVQVFDFNVGLLWRALLFDFKSSPVTCHYIWTNVL